ncbi:hypothetical protein ABBQ32_000844 [Trebouxia sp. C0010 RCD-2024]
MFKQLVKKRTFSGYQSCIRTTDVFSSAHFVTSWCDKLTARAAHQEIAYEATCKPAKATSPDRLKLDTTTGWPWSAIWGCGSHQNLNAWRRMTAAAGGAQDNKQQSKVPINIPKHSLVPRRWSGDIPRRPQGTRRQQVPTC